MSRIIYVDYTGCEFDPPLEIDEAPKTHFDEIKSMSVEELAEWMCQTQFREGDFCPPEHGWKYCQMADGCRACWLDWLNATEDKGVEG